MNNPNTFHSPNAFPAGHEAPSLEASLMPGDMTSAEVSQEQLLPGEEPLVAQEVPLDLLLPIQAEGVSAPYLEELEAADPDQLPPVEAVAYGDRLLLVDGNHRAVRAHRDGAVAIRAFIATEDTHLRHLTSPALTGINTISDLHKKYTEDWLPQIEAANITNVATIPQHNAYTRTHMVAPVEISTEQPHPDGGINVPM